MTRAAERLLSCGGIVPGVEHLPAADVLSPADRYQELFVAVQSEAMPANEDGGCNRARRWPD